MAGNTHTRMKALALLGAGLAAIALPGLAQAEPDREGWRDAHPRPQAQAPAQPQGGNWQGRAQAQAQSMPAPVAQAQPQASPFGQYQRGAGGGWRGSEAWRQGQVQQGQPVVQQPAPAQQGNWQRGQGPCTLR